jgi:hypothetical protein
MYKSTKYSSCYHYHRLGVCLSAQSTIQRESIDELFNATGVSKCSQPSLLVGQSRCQECECNAIVQGDCETTKTRGTAWSYNNNNPNNSWLRLARRYIQSAIRTTIGNVMHVLDSVRGIHRSELEALSTLTCQEQQIVEQEHIAVVSTLVGFEKQRALFDKQSAIHKQRLSSVASRCENRAIASKPIGFACQCLHT